MTAKEHIPTAAVDLEGRLEAVASLLQELASDMGTVATIVHNVIGDFPGTEETLPAKLHAAATLAEVSAALADRVSVACADIPAVRGGHEEWVLSPAARNALRMLEAPAAG